MSTGARWTADIMGSPLDSSDPRNRMNPNEPAQPPVEPATSEDERR